MKKTIHLCLLTFCLMSLHLEISWGQCDCRAGHNSWTTLTTPPPWTGADYFNGVSYNTYLQLSGAVQGDRYSLVLTGCSNPTLYLVVTSGTHNGPTVACGFVPLNFTASQPTGTNYFVHIFQNDDCSGSNFNQSCGRLTFGAGTDLSVELISFAGNTTELGNQLQWQTATETDNDYFELESTTDGVEFKIVGRVKGAGTSKTLKQYDFFDYTSEQTTYYRLKQTDFDGNFVYHPTIAVKRGENKEVLISPNPVTDKFYVTLDVGTAGTYHFSFVNALGASIERNVVLEKGMNRIEMDVSEELRQGFYILLITDDNGTVISTNKFVKK